MATISVRQATIHDAPAIARVQVDTWRSAYRGIVSDRFLNQLSREDRTIRWREILQTPDQVAFVAISSGEVIGFGTCGPERAGRVDFRGEVYGLYVLPEWHGKRVGKQLFVTLARWLFEHSFHTLLVWTLGTNPFRTFYEYVGGKLVGEQVITIDGDNLREVAYGWASIEDLIADADHRPGPGP